jgi:hypothetical protein
MQSLKTAIAGLRANPNGQIMAAIAAQQALNETPRLTATGCECNQAMQPYDFLRPYI